MSSFFLSSTKLAAAPRNLFFTGKGGVGKTSSAAATALALVDLGRKVLLVSTDSASNLDEMLGCSLSNQASPVPMVPRLSVLSIDPGRALKSYQDRVIHSMPGLSATKQAQTLEEMSGSCTMEIAVFDEFTSLLAPETPPHSNRGACCPPKTLAEPRAPCCVPKATAEVGTAGACCPKTIAEPRASCCVPKAAAEAGAAGTCCPPKTAVESVPVRSAEPMSEHPTSSDFDHIIFDTAPSSHTIKLLSLPRAWSSFLTGNERGASCLGPSCGMSVQRVRFEAAVSALTDHARTLLVIVTRPERAALAEASKTARELREVGLSNQHLLVNGVFHASAQNDETAKAFESSCAAELATMPELLRSLPRDDIPLRAFNMLGLNALRALFSVEDPPGQVGPGNNCVSLSAPGLHSLVGDLAKSPHGLIMVMGKGGVGKTTLAAAVALGLARRGLRVHLSTTDTTSHLRDIFEGGSVQGLELSRIDPVEEKANYIQNVMMTRGANLDEGDRALLEEDLKSPCTEEVAIFEAFSRIVASTSAQLVVLDTAPTGHSLLLLDSAGAYERQARQIGAEAPRVTPPLARLQDKNETRVIIVATPEPTPVSQAITLQDDLLRAGIEPYAWILNKSLAASRTQDPVLVARASAEFKEWVRAQAVARRLFGVPFTTQALCTPASFDCLLSAAAPENAASAQ